MSKMIHLTPEEFDELVRKAKRVAWDEGYSDAMFVAHDHHGRTADNPYLKEDD